VWILEKLLSFVQFWRIHVGLVIWMSSNEYSSGLFPNDLTDEVIDSSWNLKLHETAYVYFIL